MNIKNVLSNSLNKFRTLPLKKPMLLEWDPSGFMRFKYKTGSITMSKIFDYCYTSKTT